MISQARVVVVGGGMMAVLKSEPAYDPANERLRA